MGNPSFDDIATTTLKKYRKELIDAITSHQALFMMMKEKGFVTEDEGGTSIVEPLLAGKNTTVQSYGGYDLIDVTPQTGITAAEYNWKQIAGTVSISGLEEFENSGSKERIISLLDSKIKQLEISLWLVINTMLASDGTGNAGKDLTGLALGVEDGAAWSTYGGIDSSTALNAFWRNQWIGTVGSFATNGVSKMRKLFNTCSRGKDKPTLIMTDQSVYEAYEQTLQNVLTIYDQKMADIGFMALVYKGVPVIFDEDITNSFAGYMYMLNDTYMKLVFGKGRNFQVSPFIRPDNQDAKVAQVLVYAQLVQSNRARQGVMNGITTP